MSGLTLFGSVARDEARPDSGVDILVEFERPVGYFTLVWLGTYLEQIPGCRVDLVTPGAQTEHLREWIRHKAMRAAWALEGSRLRHPHVYLEIHKLVHRGGGHVMPETRSSFKRLASPEAERMVLEENLFVEGLFPQRVMRKPTDTEMEAYHHAFREPGEA